MTGRNPPRIAEAILRGAMGRGPLTETVLGDSREEWAARQEGAGPVGSHAWHLLHAIGLSFELGLWARIRHGRMHGDRERNPAHAMDETMSDVQQATRRLLRSPGFTMVVRELVHPHLHG